MLESVRQFNFADLKALMPQEAQAKEYNAITSVQDNPGIVTSESFTFMKGNEIVGCAGLYPIWQGRAYLWAFISKNATASDLLGGTKFALKWLDRMFMSSSFNRIETAVLADFDAGHRWVTMLGFEKEGLMKKYDPNGLDYVLYARTNTWAQ